MKKKMFACMALLILFSMVLLSSNASALYSLKVTVKDKQGEPIPNAYVKIRPWLIGYGGFTDENGEFTTPDTYNRDDIVRIYAKKAGEGRAYRMYNFYYDDPQVYDREVTLTLNKVASKSAVRIPILTILNQFPLLQRLLNL